MHSRRAPAVLGLQYAALFGYIVFLAFPLLWMLSTSFKTPSELVEVHPALVPHQPTLSNYDAALGEQNLVRAAANSLTVAVATAVLTVLVALPAAYALVRYRSVLRKVTLGWILVSQVFPLILIVIPLFLILKRLELINSLPGLVLVYLVWALPFTLWMLQGYVRSVPREVEEAAAVDGAGRVRILRSIVLPLLTPGIVATAMFAFISAWNEFFFALVLLQSPDLATLPLTLARFVGVEGVVRLGPLAAASLLATLPSLILFSFLQRRLSSDALAGAVKG
jgi:multiple sugar transport system permease protein